jgi:beta propeller repeat protein
MGRGIVFFYNGSSTTQLTNNNFNDANPQIYGSNVVWRGYDGNDYEIFLYNGSRGIITQLTDNSFNDYGPQIYGSNIVWHGFDGNDYEIILATFNCPYVLAGDFNGDCIVDLYDFAAMASNWLIDCLAEPGNPVCVPK